METIDTKGLMVVLKVSQPAIHKRALKENWPYIEEVGKARGGRLKKYLIASLPTEIRAAIMKRQSDELAEKMPKRQNQAGGKCNQARKCGSQSGTGTGGSLGRAGKFGRKRHRGEVCGIAENGHGRFCAV